GGTRAASPDARGQVRGRSQDARWVCAVGARGRRSGCGRNGFPDMRSSGLAGCPMLRPVTHDEAAGLLPGYAAATLDLADAARVRAHLASGPRQTDDRGAGGAGGERPEAPAARADAAGRSGPEAAPERREVAPAERAAPTDAERSAPHIAYSPDVLSIQVAKAPLTAVL